MKYTWKERKNFSNLGTIYSTVPASIIIVILSFFDVIHISNTLRFLLILLVVVGITVFFVRHKGSTTHLHKRK